MSKIAYALRAEHHDTYLGGVLAIGDDSLDVRQALEDNNGFIVIDDTETTAQMVLDAYPPLERVAAPGDDHPGMPVGYVEPDSTADPLADMNVADLRAHAKELGIDNPGRSREEIVDSITTHVTAAGADPAADAGAGTASDNPTEG